MPQDDIVIKRQLDLLKKEKFELTSKIEAVSEEKAKLQASNASLQKDISVVKSENIKLNEQFTSLNKEKLELSSRMDAVSKENAELQASNISLQNNISAVKSENIKLNEQFTSLKSERSISMNNVGDVIKNSLLSLKESVKTEDKLNYEVDVFEIELKGAIKSGVSNGASALSIVPPTETSPENISAVRISLKQVPKIKIANEE